MERLDVSTLVAHLEHVVETTTERVAEFQEREFTGSAADELVVATVSGGALTVDIHVLAKRRLEREELGQAVVEAVAAAESNAADAMTELTLEPGRADSSLSETFHAHYREAMREMRARLP